VLPLSRAYRPDSEERLIREFVLQLKLGRVRPKYFADKYGANVLTQFEQPLRALADDGYAAEVNDELIALTRDGLLRVDALLPRFFQAKHAGIRYT
jgi:oxygen-independent coproporphyrinogen-3 oxidase